MSVLQTEAVQSEVNKKMVDKRQKITLPTLMFVVIMCTKIWTSVIEECLVCKRERQNVEDKNAVVVVKDGFLVGHAPKCFSLWMSMHVSLISSIKETCINCKITGNRVNRGAGNGLEIPCEYST